MLSRSLSIRSFATHHRLLLLPPLPCHILVLRKGMYTGRKRRTGTSFAREQSIIARAGETEVEARVVGSVDIRRVGPLEALGGDVSIGPADIGAAAGVAEMQARRSRAELRRRR